MTRRVFILALLVTLFLWLPATAASQSEEKKAAQEPESKKAQSKEGDADREEGQVRLRIEVTGGEKAEPVENASVYVKYVEERSLRRDRKIEMNVKTNRDGRVTVPRVPRGKVLVQVIATGWKTFGQWFDIEKDDETIKIRLQKPPRWY
jgi:hypothetical protein